MTQTKRAKLSDKQHEIMVQLADGETLHMDRGWGNSRDSWSLRGNKGWRSVDGRTASALLNKEYLTSLSDRIGYHPDSTYVPSKLGHEYILAHVSGGLSTVSMRNEVIRRLQVSLNNVQPFDDIAPYIEQKFSQFIGIGGLYDRAKKIADSAIGVDKVDVEFVNTLQYDMQVTLSVKFEVKKREPKSA